jgi:hypothetical protein
MTRRDYVLIAAALKGAHDSHIHTLPGAIGVRTAALTLADTLAQDNPRFDRDRFLKACGVAQ